MLNSIWELPQQPSQLDYPRSSENLKGLIIDLIIILLLIIIINNNNIIVKSMGLIDSQLAYKAGNRQHIVSKDCN